MPINLSRNTKVYFTTNTANIGGVPNSPLDTLSYTAATLFEVSVQDGYSLSQSTQEQTISVNEAGNNAVRGSRSFNTALDPVDFSFSTYVRPILNTNRVECAERLLWNALFGTGAVATTPLAITSQPTRAATTAAAAATATVVFTGTATGLALDSIVNFSESTNAEWNQPARVITAPVVATNTTCTVEFMKPPAQAAGLSAPGTSVAYVGQWARSGTAAGAFSYTSTMASNRNQLQGFGMIFVIDNVIYSIDNCVMDSATIDFGLDQIAMIQWAGKGARIRTLATVTGAHLTASATAAPTQANYITNKLSTLTLASNIGGSKTTDTVPYTLAITGGQVTISNNVTYLTPNNLSVVNSAITYFTGARSISGNVTAYLRTGETFNSSGTLYDALLAGSATTTEPKFYAQLEMGGGANATRVEFEMPGVKLQIPTVDVQDIVSTTINFMAQPHNVNYAGQAGAVGTFDLARTNELLVKYYSA